MKIAIFVLLSVVLTVSSCKKDSNTVPDNVEPIIPSADVSGKLKKIIASYTGTRKADIVNVEYDATNKVTKYDQWTEDSAFTPIKITDARYAAFYYNGANDFPYKNILTYTDGSKDSCIYQYDSQNRVVFETQYFYLQTTIYRNAITYLNSNAILLQQQFKLAGSSTYQISNTDSLVLSSNNKVIERRNTAFPNTDKDIYTYDTKDNPLARLNFAKYIFSLNGDDRIYFYRSPNNMLTYSNNNFGNIISISNTYTYSSNNFPIKATTLLMDPNPANSINYKVQYLYY